MGKIGVDLPIRPRKGHILVANSRPEALLHPVLEAGYEATGHEGAGICLAPVTEEIISKWIAEGQAPELGKAVRPSRFL